MGLWDIEDNIEDFFSENYVHEENNRYLSSAEDTIKLISKILPIEKKASLEKNKEKQIKEILEIDFLSALNKMQLQDEAQLQIRLSVLSDQLVGQIKHSKDKIVIGLGGKFSAGKSKFINSILKVEGKLLPDKINPTTSIPTYVVYGEKEEISAYTYENKRVILDLEALQALTHDIKNKYQIEITSFIKYLTVSVPNMPYRKLLLLDTPGYSKADPDKKEKNTTDEHKAYIQLKSVDYLIWLIDIENGVLSQSDINFISGLEMATPILFVVNKSDKRVAEDIEQVVSLVHKTAKGAGLNVYGVTAYSSINNEEWDGKNMISNFFEMAMKNKCIRDEIFEQIDGIKNKVLSEINSKLTEKVEEHKLLENIILESDDIMKTKSLIELYGETTNSIKDMMKCRKEYKKVIKKLEKQLKNW